MRAASRYTSWSMVLLIRLLFARPALLGVLSPRARRWLCWQPALTMRYGAAMGVRRAISHRHRGQGLSRRWRGVAASCVALLALASVDDPLVSRHPEIGGSTHDPRFRLESLRSRPARGKQQGPAPLKLSEV